MSLSDTGIRLAAPEDIPMLFRALENLASDLSDPFTLTPERLTGFLFADNAQSFALVAGAEDEPLGALVASPRMSTACGGACIFISDLWVAESARGRSLGRRLLAAAANEGSARWKTRALILNVYDENKDAVGFYRHLGFELSQSEHKATLGGDALGGLMAGQEARA